VIRAESIEHLFDVASALAYQPLPAGDRMAIVTNAGGPGIMMSDALELAASRSPRRRGDKHQAAPIPSRRRIGA